VSVRDVFDRLPPAVAEFSARMALRPLETIRVRPARPGWLTAGLTRLALLSLFIVLVGMFRPHLTRVSAAVGVVVAAALVLVALAWFFGAVRRLARALPFLQAGERFTDAMLTAFALLTAYVSSFVDWGRPPRDEAPAD
jgi:hypothetical protein